MTETAVPGLAISHIVKSYGKLEIVRDVSLQLPAGSLLTLLGPSGCGKTTLLSIVAGFVQSTAGQIEIDGERIDHLPPERRPTSIMFQSYGLFPHMTVFENVAFGPRLRGSRGEKLKGEVHEVLELVHLSSFAGRYPAELSGGQQQRAALARSLVVRPRVLLLDEPFAALDRNLRERMQIELRKLQQQVGITMIVVTHDQHEALVLSDFIAVMNQGKIEQFAEPNAVYDRPASRFVASFMGIANMLEGAVVSAGVKTYFEASGSRIPVNLHHGDAARPCCLAFRSENVSVVSPGSPSAVPGKVLFTRTIGNQVTYEIDTDAGLVMATLARDLGRLSVGERVGVVIDPERSTVLYA